MDAGERYEPIEYGVLPVVDAMVEYPELWQTVRHDLPRLTNAETAMVVSMITGVCHHCYKAASDCQCWNDE